jgi:hypothetical protein
MIHTSCVLCCQGCRTVMKGRSPFPWIFYTLEAFPEGPIAKDIGGTDVHDHLYYFLLDACSHSFVGTWASTIIAHFNTCLAQGHLPLWFSQRQQMGLNFCLLTVWHVVRMKWMKERINTRMNDVPLKIYKLLQVHEYMYLKTAQRGMCYTNYIIFWIFILHIKGSLRPGTVASWEAEIGRIAVWGQSKREKVHEIPISISGVCLSSLLPRKTQRGGLQFRPACAQSGTLISKITNAKRIGVWLKCYSACLASTRPWVKLQYWKKKKKAVWIVPAL